MPQMLLVNPRARRKARRNPVSTVKRAANPKRRRRAHRAHNPVAPLRRKIMARKNPARGVRRRRRNPIGMGALTNTRTWMDMLKNAGIGAVGSVGVDILMGYIKPHLPTSLQPNMASTAPDVYDALKAGVTVVAGILLDKPTKGLSKKAAQGALTVQFAQLLTQVLPAGIVPATGLGYAVPGAVIRGSSRIAPLRISAQNANMSAYQRTGAGTPMLSAYQRPGQTALLSGAAQSREGVSLFR